MNLKTNLTYLSILIGLVLFSNQMGFAQIETAAIIPADENRNKTIDNFKLQVKYVSEYDLCLGLTSKQTLQKFHPAIRTEKMGFEESGRNYDRDHLVRNTVNENKAYLNDASPVLPTLSYEHFALNQDLGNQVETKEFYLHKAKNQNTAAWILLVGGTVMTVVGLIGFDQNFDLGGPITLFGPPQSASQATNSSSADIYGFIAVAGIFADLASIPFFIGSHHNKKMASLISFGNQKINAPRLNSLSMNLYPTLTLNVNF